MAITRIGNGDVTVEVSSLGAEMQSITTSDGADWLWHGDAEFWAGRSPVLFPIVGKAPGDHVTIDGAKMPMGQHGFARRSEFALVDEGADFCRHELMDGPTSRMSFPFAFSLVIEHRVEGRGVRVSAEVTNKDDRVMPFGLGFHPAFNWPLPGCEGQEHSVTLDSGASPELVRLSGGLLDFTPMPSPFVDGRLVLQPELFADDALIFPEGAGAGARYAAGEKAIHFTWDNLPNFAIWTKPGAPFVCLEPWHGMAAEAGAGDSLDERPFTETLGPGAAARFGFGVRLEG